MINENVHFLHEPEKFKFLPNVIKGLKKIQDMQYKIVIVTNQGGIGMGYFSKEDFFRVNSKMLKELDANGIKIDKIMMCPHSQSVDCECRKPKTALFKIAKEDLNIDETKSFMIGDSSVDIQAGMAFGTKTVLISSKESTGKTASPDFVAKDLLEAADYIKKVEDDL